MSLPPVTVNEARSRFEIVVDGLMSFMTFRKEWKSFVLVHTEVPAGLEGRGVGSALVQFALDYARTNGLNVTPQCEFVRSYLKRHPDEARESGIDPTTL